MLDTALPLIYDGHWELADALLTYARITLHYAGLFIHGFRLLMNIIALMESGFTQESAMEGLKQQIAHSWFELCNDVHWLISIITPSSYIMLSCALLVVELGLIMLRGHIESNRLVYFKTAFNTTFEDKTLLADSMLELNKSKAHTQAMLQHTYKKLVLNIGSTLITTSLFVLKHVILPSVSITLACNPIVPFIFAALTLLISVSKHLIGQHIDKKKPKIKIDQLSGKQSSFARHTFFKTDTHIHAAVEHKDNLIPIGST